MENFIDFQALTIQTFDDSDNKRGELAVIFAFDAKRIAELQKQGAGAYFAVNPQEDQSQRGINNTKAFKRLGLDLDVAKEEQNLSKAEIASKKAELLKKLTSLQIPPNYIIDTKNGVQPLWEWQNPIPLKTIEDRNKANTYYRRIVAGFSKVTGLKSEGDSITRVLRLPDTLHLKTPDDPFSITIEKLNPNPVDFEKFIETYPPDSEAVSNSPRVSVTDAIGLKDGEGRNQTLHDLACSFILRDGAKNAWVAIKRLNETGEQLPASELKTLFNSAESWIVKQSPKAKGGLPDVEWPQPLAPEAFYGVLGELVKAIAPHTEADEAALLLDFLCAFGNIIGSSAFFKIEADKHPARLNVVLVGSTASGRKGTATSYIRKIFREIDDIWANKIQTGLSSGEGLIWAVRDEIKKTKKVKDEFIEEIVDEGIADKRLLVVEGEFSQTLRVMAREGNTLSSVLRNAWDNGDLQTLTKNSPAKATNAHISIIANITPDELTRYLTDTDTNNGFANRFLWVCTKRSKYLPRGGNLQESALTPIIERLKAAVKYASYTEEITRSEKTWAIWEQVYPKLSGGREGLIGALTSRADANVTRISCIFALLDQSDVVEPEHLLAALAVWQYIEDSVKYIFQNRIGDFVADRIFEVLQQKGALTKTDISNLFDRHQKATRINDALVMLENNNLIVKRTKSTDGRDIENWTLAREEGEVLSVN